MQVQHLKVGKAGVWVERRQRNLDLRIRNHFGQTDTKLLEDRVSLYILHASKDQFLKTFGKFLQSLLLGICDFQV